MSKQVLDYEECSVQMYSSVNTFSYMFKLVDLLYSLERRYSKVVCMFMNKINTPILMPKDSSLFQYYFSKIPQNYRCEIICNDVTYVRRVCFEINDGDIYLNCLSFHLSRDKIIGLCTDMINSFKYSV